MEKAEKLTELIGRIEAEGEKLKADIDFLMETTANENHIEEHHFISAGYFHSLLKEYLEFIGAANPDEQV